MYNAIFDKSAVFSSITDKAERRDRERCLFAEFCEEALKYGHLSAGVLESPKRVLVLMNDQANDGKSKVNFERYSLPLLHLAGYDVNVIRVRQ
ncbi:unnamed protein product [Soboliphyme baturini]|uniref:DAGKc domain-containing protein n=1 Tax=Soboliphyme baturini TaxID=241478 RepID=A0A183IK26_9BILA|nr:unnamed protein product [Soboliphyme baturini]